MLSLGSTIAICVATAALAVACRPRSSDNTPSPPSASSAPAAPSASAAPADTAASFPIPAASVELVLNPQHLPVYDGPTGSVEGMITVKGPPAPPVHVDIGKCPAAVDTYGTLFREGRPTTPNGPRPLADAVVVAVGYSGFYLPEKEPAVSLTIGPNCAYASRTIAITYGQRLEVSNQSSLLFAPLLDPSGATAVMVAPPKGNGDPVKLYPLQAGYFTLKDRMEPFVREDLYVFRHPLHAVSDTRGHYRIDGLPVGKLKIGAHHPMINADAEAPVEVVANVVQKVDLTITYKPAPKKAVRGDAGVLPVWKMPND